METIGSNDPNLDALSKKLIRDIGKFSHYKVEDFKLCPVAKRWIPGSNFVAIKIQEAQAGNLRITLYGDPYDFEGIQSELPLKPDMASYSRFLLCPEDDYISAIKLIHCAYLLKRGRGRKYIDGILKQYDE